jgi:hypothetical protein
VKEPPPSISTADGTSPDTPALGDIVHLVALLGGYTGKSSGGPPGPTVIGRGLEKVAVAAETLRMMRAK